MEQEMKKIMLIFLVFVYVHVVSILSGAELVIPDEVFDFNLKAGDYGVLISGKLKWTINEITFDGTVVGHRNGFYGFVVEKDRGGNFLGSGHKEAGEEKVEGLVLVIDGKEVEPEKKTYDVEKEAVLRKYSVLENIHLESVLRFTEDGIIEERHFEIVGGDQEVRKIYEFLYCWSPDSTEYYAEKLDGGIIDAKFDPSKPGQRIMADVKYQAQYYPDNSLVQLAVFPEPIKGKEIRSSIWDHSAYHKQYLQTHSQEVIKEGTRLSYRIVQKIFTASDANKWKDEAKKLAAKTSTAVGKTTFKPVLLPPPGKVKKTAVEKNVSSDSSKELPVSKAVSFFIDYSKSQDSVNATQSEGDPEGEIILAPAPVYDFDLMSHANRGLFTGMDAASVRYASENNLPETAGSIEVVMKPEDWEPNDNVVHGIFQTDAGGNTPGKLFMYKYKTSGISVFLIIDPSGEKIFLNKSTAHWKKGTWHHIVFTYDLKKEVALYVDGVEAGRKSLNTAWEWPKKFTVGPAMKADYLGYAGRTAISSVTLYRKALSAAEVIDLAVGKNIVQKSSSGAGAGTGEGNAESEELTGKKSAFFTSGQPRMGLEALSDKTVLPPWTAVAHKNGEIKIWNRSFNFSGNGLISSAASAGGEMLARPIEVVGSINGKALSMNWGGFSVSKSAPAQVVLLKKITAADAEVSCTGTFEYDGMAWFELTIKPEKNINVDQLDLVMPVKAEIAQFIHYVGAPHTYESQDLVHNSFSKELSTKPGVIFTSGQKTMVWLGNNDRGLLWFSESDKYWWPKDRGDAVTVSREKDSVVLKISVITEKRSFTAGNPVTFAFGFMGTPVKPILDGWRGFTVTAQYDGFVGDTRGNHLIYWPDKWRWMMLDMDPTRATNVSGLKKRLEMDLKDERTIIPYWTRLHFTRRDRQKVNPDLENMESWSTLPDAPHSSTVVMSRGATTSPWADYLVWSIEEWAKVIGHNDGWYLDETQPIPNYRTESGGGYIDYSTNVRPTFEFFGSRDMMKRVTYNIWKRNNTRPVSVAHCSATHVMPYLSTFEIMLIGEQYYIGYFQNRNPEFIPPEGEELYYYSYSLPMDRLRAECYWKQWGEVMAFLPCLKAPSQRAIMTNSIPTRDMLSRVQQADMIVWPLFCASEEVHATWKFRREFGISDAGVEFIPYWENKSITTGDDQIVAGYYRNGNKYLVIVSNLHRAKKNVSLTFNGLNISSIKNAENNNPLKQRGNVVSLEIARNDYTALRINY